MPCSSNEPVSTRTRSRINILASNPMFSSWARQSSHFICLRGIAHRQGRAPVGLGASLHSSHSIVPCPPLSPHPHMQPLWRCDNPSPPPLPFSSWPFLHLCAFVSPVLMTQPASQAEPRQACSSTGKRLTPIDCIIATPRPCNTIAPSTRRVTYH